MTGCALLVAYSKIRLPANGWLFVCGLLSSLALIGCLIAARTGRSAVFGSDLAVGIACSLFLFGLLQLDFEPHYSYYSRTAHLFAGFSYSLYVLHFPLLLFLRAWIVPSKRWQPDAAHLFCALIVGATVLGFAWLVAVFTENKTHLVRNWIRNRIHYDPVEGRAGQLPKAGDPTGLPVTMRPALPEVLADCSGAAREGLSFIDLARRKAQGCALRLLEWKCMITEDCGSVCRGLDPERKS
jgi:peptidoglycan/LPS O-acetylase OafA/YrhL